jgi:hypothetical protein
MDRALHQWSPVRERGGKGRETRRCYGRKPKRPGVGTPDYPSRIPDMHPIHDPMISVSWIHISELITELHHLLQYRMIYLQLVTWPSMPLPRRASLQLSSRYQAALMTHVMPTTLQAIWLGDVPSSHQRHRNHRHLPRSLLHSLTKLIARDKAVSTFWNYTRKPSKKKYCHAVWL